MVRGGKEPAGSRADGSQLCPVPCREQAGKEQRGCLPAACEELHPQPPSEPGEPGAVPWAGHHRCAAAEGGGCHSYQAPSWVAPHATNLPSHPGQVSSPLLDMSTLMASQILMEQVASEGSGLLLHLLYQHLLFDFRIWSNSDFAVRLGGSRGICRDLWDGGVATRAAHGLSMQVTSSTWPTSSRTTSSASARNTGCNTSSTPSGRTTGELLLVAGASSPQAPAPWWAWSLGAAHWVRCFYLGLYSPCKHIKEALR